MYRKELFIFFYVTVFTILPAFSYEPWHSGTVGGISKDSTSSFLLSASLDNSLKLWDLPEGAFLKNFLLPPQARKNGQLFSCALSSNGKIAAAAGWHSSQGSVCYTLYFFCTQTAKLINAVSSLESAALDLKFSRNGNMLAVAFRRGGIKVFEVSTGTLLASLQSSSAAVYSVEFSENGELLSADSQGVVRLYSNNFKLIKSMQLSGGRVLSDISVSADGTLAALAFERPGGVALIALPELVIVRELLFNDSKRCGAVFVGWARGSNTIVGTFSRAYGTVQTSFFRWEISNGYRFKETVLNCAGINDIKVLADGSFVYGGFDGEWGRVDSMGRVVYKVRKPSSQNASPKFTMELISPALTAEVYDSVIAVVLELRGAGKLLDFELYVNGVRQPAVFTDVLFEYHESRRRILVPLAAGRNRVVLWAAAVCGQRASVTAIIHRKSRVDKKRLLYDK